MGAWESAPNHLVYQWVRNNVITLMEEHPDAAGRIVPACPEWTVHDLVEHFVDVCELATRRLTGEEPGEGLRTIPSPAGPPPLPRLLAEWRDTGMRLDDLVAAQLNRSTNVLVMDAFTHELDLREALGVAPPDRHPGYPGVLDFVVGGFSGQLTSRGLPALEITIPSARWTAGGDQPAATLTAGSPHDLLRTLTGRRTAEQIAALEWSADPAPWLPAFAWGPFTPPERPAEKALSGAK